MTDALKAYKAKRNFAITSEPAEGGEAGQDVLYYENIEGGHGGAANNEQAAYMQALSWTFLKQKLF